MTSVVNFETAASHDDTDAPVGTVICTYEDRPSAMPGLSLLARSLNDHAPGLRLVVVSPLAEARCLANELPNIVLIDAGTIAAKGWSVKPEVLLQALVHAPAALWLDTDVIVSGDLEGLIRRFPDDAVVVGEEFSYRQPGGCSARARAWGLAVGRELDWMVNSGSVRVTRDHRPLLERWRAMLADPAFVAAQALQVAERPIHLLGDQDVLGALLASREFADLPLHYIRNGPDMIQHSGANGFHVRQRLRMIFSGPPAFVHMLGKYKPWSFGRKPSLLRQRSDYFHLVCFELSPFHRAARPYAKALGDPAWLRTRTTISVALNAAAVGNVALRGLPLALIGWLGEWRRGGPPSLSGK